MNKLERNRYKSIIYLAELRDYQADTKLFNKIESVAGEKELEKLPSGFNSMELNQMQDNEILDLLKDLGYRKEKGADFDVKINNIPYKLLTLKNFEYFIIKDKTRMELEEKCSQNNIDIESIDTLIRDYWDYLDSNTIQQKTLLNNNFNQESIAELLKLINSIMFGENLNYKLLLINKPFRVDSWQLITPENFFKTFRDKLYISIENNDILQKIGKMSMSEQESINKWTGFYKNSFLGALRVKLG